MDPQKPTNSSPVTPIGGGFSNANLDIPPAPTEPHPATPPQSPPPPVVPSASPTAQSQPVLGGSTPPPASTPPSAPPPSSSIVTPKSGSKVSKKLFMIIAAVLFLIFGAIILITVVLPKLSGGDKKTTISWWGLWEEPQTIQPLIDEYQSTHPNIVVKYEKASKEQYRERLANALAQGSGPDIMTLHNSWIPMFRSTLSPMPATVFSPQEYQQTFYPIITADMTLGASIVGIPSGYDGLALYVNDEIFSTYGKTAPKTWNELRDTALELTVRDENGVIKQAGVAMGTTSNIDDWQEILALLMLQNGVDLKTPTGPLAEQAITFYTIMSTKDGDWDETLPQSTVMFANGKLAMMIAPSWRAHEILEQKPDLKFHVAPVPQLPKNSPEEPDITYATYWVNSVSQKSAVQPEAWEFLKFLSTKESYEKLYANASKVRAFGQPYPRVDMRDSIAADPKVGGFISLAGNAKSWYLYDRTWDGETGINSRIGKYFEDAINSVRKSSGTSEVSSALNTVSLGVTQVLADYGLVAAPLATPKK